MQKINSPDASQGFDFAPGYAYFWETSNGNQVKEEN
jgi:hypothetical protein